MIYVHRAPPDTKVEPRSYVFRKPAQVRVRKPDGSIERVGYGIGETVQVMEPSIIYLVHSQELKDEILLADGSAIIEWPRDIDVVMRYGPSGFEMAVRNFE